MKVSLKALFSIVVFILLFLDKYLHKLMPIGVYEQIGKERDTICSHSDADDLLKNELSELDTYAIDKELQHDVNKLNVLRIISAKWVLLFHQEHCVNLQLVMQ